MYIHPWDIIESQMSGKTSALKFDATSIDRKRLKFAFFGKSRLHRVSLCWPGQGGRSNEVMSQELRSEVSACQSPLTAPCEYWLCDSGPGNSVKCSPNKTLVNRDEILNILTYFLARINDVGDAA